MTSGVLCAAFDSDAELNINGFKAVLKDEGMGRDKLMKTIGVQLEDVLKFGLLGEKERIKPDVNLKFKKLTRELDVNTELLRESSRKIKFYNELLLVFQEKYSEGPVKDAVAACVIELSKRDIFGLKDSPDGGSNSDFLVNLAVSLKSYEIDEKEVWYFVKEFTDFVTIGKPREISGFFALLRTKKKTMTSVKKSNAVPAGLPVGDKK
ncbi:MAG: hypothetical protein JXA66_05525 [Oligoflexia bacterium]|nr:hypothetical protein [Oligoflexia bacterium]